MTGTPIALSRDIAPSRFLDTDLVAEVLQADGDPLTQRERDVLRVAADGVSTEDIAATLFLSAVADWRADRGEVVAGRTPRSRTSDCRR